MTIEEALDIVVARTGHHRYRELVDPAHPDYDPRFIPIVIDAAKRAPARTVELARLMTACPFRSVPPGCCAGGRCALRGGAEASHIDCFDCLEQYG